jgi:integrase/recombinase XerD
VAITYVTNECTQVLRQYLNIRPSLEIDGRKTLFYTDFGKRWDRRDVYRRFIAYKKLARIETYGSVHVFSHHNGGSILVKNGCYIVTIKELMMHSDVHTTMRYLHISDATKRGKYGPDLKL